MSDKLVSQTQLDRWANKEWREWAAIYAEDEYEIARLSAALATAREMHNAWRKRAEEAEAKDNRWREPTPLTLDTLRAELGEPTVYSGGVIKQWEIEGGDIAVVEGTNYLGEWEFNVKGFHVRTLGQLRRLLSAVREIETRSGGDAGK